MSHRNPLEALANCFYVILNEVKDLNLLKIEILRTAQNDQWWSIRSFARASFGNEYILQMTDEI